VVAEVVDSLGFNLQEGHVEIRVPRPLPVVRCDRVRVRELFHNLVINAMKYNDKAEKWIEIGSVQGGGGPPALYVRDNGIGIQEKHFDSIFRIFKRLHGRDKFGGGTGAGLTIVKKIVERHNGRIWVESKVGEGTTVYFTLEKEA
jgi:chemotaxis family two-component system sensor kinase Cph1